MSLTIGSFREPQLQALPQAYDRTTRPEDSGRAPVAEGIARMLAAATARPEPDGGGTGTRELVASEDSVTAGGVRDAYDLKLYREPDGSYTLELNMKIEFDFKTGVGDDGLPLEWTEQQKQEFMADYVRTVEEVWDGRKITTADGQEVTLDINLDVSEEAGGLFGSIGDAFDSSEHWNIDVTRVPEGGFRQSSVTPGRNTGDFDSEDVTLTPKGDQMQYGSAHEFGHMIGLPDEYPADSPHTDDDPSVMNRGGEVRDRHLDILEDWVDDEI